MIGEILPEAIAVAISPTRIMAIVLILSTPRGNRAAVSFMLGWTIGLVAVGVVTYVIAEPADASTIEGPATWVGWLYLVLGVVAVGAGLTRFLRGRRSDGEAAVPAWARAVDQLTRRVRWPLGSPGWH